MSFLDNVKAVPIADYAARIGFTVIRKGKYFSLKEHDSVIIDSYKNCFWRNSVFQRGQRGGAGSVIDFAIEFGGCRDTKAAMRELALSYGIEGDTPSTVKPTSYSKSPEVKKEKKEIGELVLPPQADNNKASVRYLCRERGIDISVVRYFLAKKMLYTDERANCVFVSHRFACVRSTGGYRFVADVLGCDYDECFYFRGSERAKTLVVAESVIDIMSIMTQFVRENKRYTDYCYLALSGTNKLPSLFYHLDKEPSITNILLALDNDDAGQAATETAIEELNNRGKHENYKIYFPPNGKDWNDYIKGNQP
jgi:hypothetical protein